MKQLFGIIPPLLISLYTFAMYRGWILVRPADRRFSEEWRQKNRKTMLFCSIMTGFAALCGILYTLGLVKVGVSK